MFMKIIIILMALLAQSAFAVVFETSEIKNLAQKNAVNSSLNEVLKKLPSKFKSELPETIKIKIKKYKGASAIPTNICGESETIESFTYGQYSAAFKTLILNEVVVQELINGLSASRPLNCQHKNTYDQVIATIIHELTHAYDSNKKVSKDEEYVRVAGFKKTVFSSKRRNITPMRSADEYEFKNIAESFAVNVEYFMMDEAFACRKPYMFRYLKDHFGSDPFPDRNCELNSTFMLHTPIGFVPHKVDLNRVYRIDYLLASKGDDISSGFGHSMYRIVMCAPDHVDPITGKFVKATPFGEKCVNDRLFHLVISYRANSEGANLDYLKGLFGGYPSMLFILSFQNVLEEYNQTELRDLESYPLKLSSTEKQEFMERVLEEHWAYRGSYKFITNNCAVESLKLVDNFVIDRNEEAKKSIRPYGILDEMIRVGLIDGKDKNIEVFNSKLEFLTNAYAMAYDVKAKKTKHARKEMNEFLQNSTPAQRLAIFQEKNSLPKTSLPVKADLITLKNHLLKVASFSVMEQQAVRVKVAVFQKKVAEYSQENQEMNITQISLESLSFNGYGVPLENELIKKSELEQSVAETEQQIAQAQELLRKLFPQDVKDIEDMALNLEDINKTSLSIRRMYRGNLEQYVKIQLATMDKAILGDLKVVREQLGADLVTTAEISDLKLQRMISEHL